MLLTPVLLTLCSTPDPDNVLIVKTPEGVFSTKFLPQNNEKQSGTRLVRKENLQEKVLPAKVSDCPAARCLPYEMLKNKVFYDAPILFCSVAPPNSSRARNFTLWGQIPLHYILVGVIFVNFNGLICKKMRLTMVFAKKAVASADNTWLRHCLPIQ